MGFFWNMVSLKLEEMRVAESRLMEYAHRYAELGENAYEMQLFDTEIPGDVVPLAANKNKKNPPPLTVHGIHVRNKKKSAEESTQPPLVLVHGYANGALYFYRNFVGLARSFPHIYSLDWLGWGLSSRPKFRLEDSSTETAEAFFVESLEAWRRANKIPKMVLAGHSIGGYLSVAYCERYPQHVDKLILLSPAGVKEETPLDRDRIQRWREQSGLMGKTALSIIPKLFDMGITPCSVLRIVPESVGYGWVTNYVERRLPEITSSDERRAIADYLYQNASLPGSGEFALNRILQVNTIARYPLISRIPRLKIPQVTFLYGDSDWMDSRGGLDVQSRCSQIAGAPQIQVLEVPRAGHLLMLENYELFNAGVVLGGLGPSALSAYVPRPRLLLPRRSQNLAFPNIGNARPPSVSIQG